MVPVFKKIFSIFVTYAVTLDCRKLPSTEQVIRMNEYQKEGLYEESLRPCSIPFRARRSPSLAMHSKKIPMIRRNPQPLPSAEDYLKKANLAIYDPKVSKQTIIDSLNLPDEQINSIEFCESAIDACDQSIASLFLLNGMNLKISISRWFISR